MNAIKLKEVIEKALSDFEADYIAKGLDAPRWPCGSGVVLVSFGRKVKVRKQLQEAGLLGMGWELYGKKHYVLNVPRGKLFSQNKDYWEGRNDRVIAEVKAAGYDLNLYNHNWID